MASRVFPTESEAQESTIERMLAEAFCCLPGVVEKFDAATQLAEVTPAIQRKIIQRNGKPKYEKIKPITKVPVVVPYVQKLGLLITLPIAKGDEGILVFSDRMIDNFVKKGGIQPPECCGADNQTTEPRAHSIIDAIFIPGIITKPNVVKSWNNEALEIRNKDRTCFFSMNKNCNITIITTGSTAVKTDGDISMNANGKVSVCGSGGVFINQPSGSEACTANSTTGSCGCSGSCSPSATDNCCNITTTGSVCCKSACPAGTSNNCMKVDSTGSLRMLERIANG